MAENANKDRERERSKSNQILFSLIKKKIIDPRDLE